MTAPYERGAGLTQRFLDWWSYIPDPVHDASVRAPKERFWPIVAPILGIILVGVVLAHAFQRAGWPA